MRPLLVLLILVLLTPSTSAAQPTYLYKARLLQAAPGNLLEVIELLKASASGYEQAGDERPILMRHSQGDRWDILMLIPMKDYVDYYSPERASKRSDALKAKQAAIDTIRPTTSAST